VHAASNASPRRIAANTAIRIAAQVVVRVLALVAFAVLARELGAGALGQIAFALAVVQLIQPVAALGLDRMTVRDVARRRGALGELWFDVLALKLVVTAAALALAVGVVAVAGQGSREVAIVALLSVMGVSSVAVYSADAVFQALERGEWVALATLPMGVLNAAAILVAVLAGGDVVAVAAAMAAAGLVSAAIAVVLVRRLAGRPPMRARPRGWPALARRATAFGVHEVLGQLIFRFDTVLLGLLAAAIAVGEYGAAFKLLEGSLFVAWALGTAVLPGLSALPPERLRGVYVGALKAALALVLPVAVTLAVLAEPVIELVYGDGFDGAEPLLRILAAALVLYAIGHIAGLVVLVRRGGRVTIAYTSAAAATHVVLCVVLIALFDATGAAAATLVTEGVIAVSAVVLAARVAGWPQPLRDLGPVLLAGAVMAAVLVVLHEELWIAVPLAGAAYLGVVALGEGRDLVRVFVGEVPVLVEEGPGVVLVDPVEVAARDDPPEQEDRADRQPDEDPVRGPEAHRR
jgi:O-antigen/teichoic acid export membrane protein